MLPKLFVFLLFLVFLGCEDSASSLQDEKYLFYEVTESKLDVQNKLRKPIYYFVVDANKAAFINWAPLSREENKIEARGEAQIPLEEILGF